MTAVATPPLFQPGSRWTMSNGNQTDINSMSADEVSRMFMPRKVAPRSNSTSSIGSSSSSTITQQSNGAQPNSFSVDPWSTKKKGGRGLWPSSKAEAMLGVSTARPHSIASAPAGPSAASAMSAVHQPSSILPSQHMLQSHTQQNGPRGAVGQIQGESPAVLYLSPMNGTFDRKTISVPFIPEVLRIGRQTNAKTMPTPINGYFDSKVLSRQHAEIWADRNGKIWIRDVKSSNGTFVNNHRLSAENRDSDPHELREGDVLELGIDIVSEDQKTVVHHKVAARVEHAGFYGNGTNVIDVNFGDIDSGAGNGLITPPMGQNMAHMRGRAGSQGSVSSNGRMGSGPQSVSGSNAGGMGQQRHMNFWLTPVTMEQIMKRLTSELKAAKQQSVELHRTGEFFDAVLAQNPVAEKRVSVQHEPTRDNLVNGIHNKADAKARFSDPPAPPPQQPLPEKPDASRLDNLGSIKRSETEKPKPTSSTPPSKTDQPQQILSLVEALATAQRELDSKCARVMDLENMLQKERQARESAEERALRLERASLDSSVQTTDQESAGSAIEEAFTSQIESNEKIVNCVNVDLEEFGTATEDAGKPKEDEDISVAESLLHEKLEKMVAEMDEMKQLMEQYRQRVEVAEEESASSRKSLAEMVEKIRQEEAKKQAASLARAEIATQTDGEIVNDIGPPVPPPSSVEQLDNAVQNGKAKEPLDGAELENLLSVALAKPHGYYDHLCQAGPYASMLGVVVLGVGLMAFLNGWQSVER